MGVNTAKVKRQLLRKLILEEKLARMQHATTKLRCKEYLQAISVGELRVFLCKVATVARNFVVVPSSKWRGDDEPDAQVSGC